MTLVNVLAIAAMMSASLVGVARAQVVPPPTEPIAEPERREEQWLIPMDQRPPFGEWTEKRQIDIALVWTGTLKNGVRVSTKYFPLDQQTSQMQIALYGGGLEEDESTRGLTEAAVLAWKTPALLDMTHADLKDRLKGWNVGATGEVAGDFARLTIAGDNVHVEMHFQLAYLLLTKPKIDPDAFAAWKSDKLSEIDKRMRGTRAAFPHVMADAIFPADDPRGRALTRQQVEAITIEKAQAWLERLVKSAPIEVGIVGRVAPEMLFDQAQRYFAGLPDRPAVTPQTNASLRQVAKPASTVVVDRTLPSVTPRAVVSWSYWACDEYDYARMLPLQVAARVATRRMDAQLKQMLPDRETRGGVSWALNAGSTFPGMGLFVGVATAPPEKADEVHAIMQRELAALGETGPTEGEMLEALPALRKQWQERVTDAGVWALVLESFAYTGVDPVKLTEVPDVVMRLTPEQVRDALREVLAQPPATSIVLRPAVAPAPPPAQVGN